MIPFQVFCSTRFAALTFIKWFSLHGFCSCPVLYQSCIRGKRNPSLIQKNKIKSRQYFCSSQIDFGSSQVSDHSTVYEILAHMHILQISVSLRLTSHHVVLWIYITLHQGSTTKPNMSLSDQREHPDFNASLGQHLTPLQSCHWMIGATHPDFPMCNSWSTERTAFTAHIPFAGVCPDFSHPGAINENSHLVCHTLGRQCSHHVHISSFIFVFILCVRQWLWIKHP